MNTTIVDVFIENIKADQELLKQAETKIESAKEQKQTIISRLKESQKEVSILHKYADESQQAKIEALGFSFSESQKGLNTVSSIAYDAILKAKDNQLTNEVLYNEYVNSLDEKSQAVKYTEFNIKCRSLFNSQKLLRKKGSDLSSSRGDIISLNGRVILEKEASKEKPETDKTPENKKKDIPVVQSKPNKSTKK